MRKWPCIEKNCSWCCNPVKIIKFTLKELPKDKYGKDLRTLIEEERIPKDKPDGVRLQIYECLLLDKNTELCKDYKNRPEICKNSSCINKDSNKSKEEQHKASINSKFYKNKFSRWKK